jgi:hypothetical protein
MEKHTLPLSAPTTAPAPKQSITKRATPIALLALLTVLALNVLPNQTTNPVSTLKDTTRSLSSHLGWTSPQDQDNTENLIYTQEYLNSHVKCPIQPKPLYPKIAWNMTKEEKVSSIDKYAEAVVSAEGDDEEGREG